ncbi:MAG: ATP-binding protein [Bryobacteraceae bacterium]
MSQSDLFSVNTDPALAFVAPRRPGFRLFRFEVLNWGTFHKQVWSLHPDGANTLLTGDIGSGKSTFVDAITTLLVPPSKVAYNKAAGADARERSLRSYFFGHYKSERGDVGLAARPVPLRDHNSYSVILGRFRNEVLRQEVTLAQVFWLKDPQAQPARFYVVADRPLSIAEHFANFGADINALRKRLRALPGVELFDSFPPYGSAYRHRFGIENEQAMVLFNQTVSMKSVGNLTEFVREHMLEPFPVEPRIDALMSHFDDLNRAHEAVLRAKNQIERLTPLVADCDALAALLEGAAQLRECRDALHAWFSSRKLLLLARRERNLAAEIQRRLAAIASLTQTRGQRARERDQVKEAIASNGGDHIERLKREIADRGREREARMRKAQDYARLAQSAGLSPVAGPDDFLANQNGIRSEQEAAESRLAECQSEITEASVEMRALSEQHADLTAEIESLRRRRSNIPRHMLDLRRQLCEVAGVDEQSLPFAGELIQVRPEERDWEGAIERLLHNFGLSLLVGESHYARVAAWVDRTHLNGRLVYFRVRESSVPRADLSPASLVHKIAVKPDSPFCDWLDAEVARRFDFICCGSIEQFRRELRAITRAGQIKTGGERHEKDDRHRIDDPSRYVLGWSNENKIAALKRQAQDLEKRMHVIAGRIQAAQAKAKSSQERLRSLGQLEVFRDYSEINWQPLAVEMERLQREVDELERNSDTLRLLGRRLKEIEEETTRIEQELSAENQARGAAENRRESCAGQLRECRDELAALDGSVRDRCFPRLEELSQQALEPHTLTVESCDARERQMREWLQSRIDAEDKKIERLRERIVSAMQSYRAAYPLETRETDASVEAAGEYRAMLHALCSDDLPRFEDRFKELLNENTIREVANFHSQLSRERETIRERIETINQSLRQIDYNPGRFIVLEADPSHDPEIRDFQQDLRACTDSSLTGSDDEYSEAKFLQVKRIIERFRGREGSAELDRRWRQKVTDVRQWFTFSASERYRDDNAEFEHYTDSGGKSGGQKEKLAYTVLAASLAYQFGLERGAGAARSFRFVTIDEAFGRGSDESARFGLELFERLDLQLLIVTPLQKIHVIEPYVASVGFVHNHEGRSSMLRNLTIEEYRAERDARGAALP